MNTKEIEALIAECREDAVRWTAEMVRIKSENPPGEEYEVACYCADKLREMGCEVELDAFLPGRANVTAYAGNKEDLGIIFNGHLDVVIAKGEWKYPPYSATIEGDKMYGRGSADMKSGCAAIMAAVKALIQMDCLQEKGVCVSFVSDEESVNKGVKHLLEHTELHAPACIVAEPSQLQVHYGNRGYASFFVRTHGVACHASNPKNGVNAIYKMARIVLKLEEFADTLSQRVNPQLGCMALSVGVIQGGTSVNTVPAFCEIEVEMRVIPGIDAAVMQKELQELLGDEAEVVFRSELLASLVEEDCELVQTAKQCVTEVRGEAVVTKFPACTEASFFSVGCGIPTILLGPGNVALAHKIDEYVPLDEIRDAVNIYIGIAKHYTGQRDS